MEKTYIATIRIPTDTYAYIEIEAEGTPDELIEIQREFKRGPGLPDTDFRNVIDEYLWGNGSMSSDEYETMNDEQKTIIQNIKRSKKRHQARTQEKDTIHHSLQHESTSHPTV